MFNPTAHMQRNKRPAPMSNTERQRRFRERHPGYYGRLHRKRNAGIKAMRKQQRIAAEAAGLARYQAELKAHAELLAGAKAIIARFNRVPVNRMLPAPTIDPLGSELAALAEKRKATAAVVCER